MVHPLKSVSYVADVDNMLVVMAHRNPPPSPGSQLKLTCHILECDDVCQCSEELVTQRHTHIVHVCTVTYLPTDM